MPSVLSVLGFREGYPVPVYEEFNAVKM